MGLDVDEDMTADNFNEDEEYNKVLQQLGVDPNKNQDADLEAILNQKEEDLDDDALLR